MSFMIYDLEEMRKRVGYKKKYWNEITELLVKAKIAGDDIYKIFQQKNDIKMSEPHLFC